MSIRGNQYDRTYGAFFSYEKLAKFIHNLHAIQCSDIHFIDLACGTGSLLEKLAVLLPANRLHGIDLESKQLTVARKRVPSIDFLKWDINKLSTLPLSSKWFPAMAHLGFCFLNILEPLKRNDLLRNLKKNNGIRYLLFEIQNDDYQSSRYREGKWYQSRLTSNVLLKSKWTYKDSLKSCKQLILEFMDKESCITDSTVIYPWHVEDCMRDLKACGWQPVGILPARYREFEGIIPSHWLIKCASHKTDECD